MLAIERQGDGNERQRRWRLCSGRRIHAALFIPLLVGTGTVSLDDAEPIQIRFDKMPFSVSFQPDLSGTDTRTVKLVLPLWSPDNSLDSVFPLKDGWHIFGISTNFGGVGALTLELVDLRATAAPPVLRVSVDLNAEPCKMFLALRTASENGSNEGRLCLYTMKERIARLVVAIPLSGTASVPRSVTDHLCESS